jgi:AraC family transcriptional regulator
MKPSATSQMTTDCLPVLSSQDQGWENILLEQFEHPSGEGGTHYEQEHTICLSIAPRPVDFFQIKGGKTHSSLYGKGDISITPAKMPFFARWQGDDQYLQIRIPSQFLQSIASETLDYEPAQLEIIPEFRTRDRQLEAIGLLLLAELQQHNLGGKLYIDSLTNVFAVHLLRQYATASPHLSVFESGLPQRQLMQVLDYIHASLDQEIKLADLAALLNMSQYHFSHMFKQAIGVAPYQYLLQQRVERAKQLLKKTDQSIIEIALACGFSSHSHLSKQFRQLTGETPTAYRAS